jgi:hypothetical protein
MPPMSKVDLFAAIRRNSRAGLSVRALARKYPVSRRIVRSASCGWVRKGLPLCLESIKKWGKLRAARPNAGARPRLGVLAPAT